MIWIRLGGNMDSNIYIQKGVKKIYNDNSLGVEYVSEFPLNISDRDGYCIDSRGVDSFFYRINGGLMECNSNIPYVRYVSLEDIDNGYISLFKFINEGLFIGREFIRTSPMITYIDGYKIKDNAYLCSDSKYIVIYAMNNIFLAKYICGNNEEYCIIDCRYINDGMYGFVGDVYEEYSDRYRVYFEIVKQIGDYCKEKSKVMVRGK